MLKFISPTSTYMPVLELAQHLGLFAFFPGVPNLGRGLRSNN